jgi:hypothetical protein
MVWVAYAFKKCIENIDKNITIDMQASTHDT